jgi:hypothetical protein
MASYLITRHLLEVHEMNSLFRDHIRLFACYTSVNTHRIPIKFCIGSLATLKVVDRD